MLIEATTSTPTRLVLEGTLPGVTPESVTDYLTDPTLLTTWWPEEAEIDADSGDFIFAWPSHERTLRGRYLDNEPGRRVRFTWRWDHEPLASARSVLVTTTRTDAGTRVTITHGDYGPDDS